LLQLQVSTTTTTAGTPSANTVYYVIPQKGINLTRAAIGGPTAVTASSVVSSTGERDKTVAIHIPENAVVLKATAGTAVTTAGLMAASSLPRLVKTNVSPSAPPQQQQQVLQIQQQQQQQEFSIGTNSTTSSSQQQQPTTQASMVAWQR
jgi:hypothetical protein